MANPLLDVINLSHYSMLFFYGLQPYSTLGDSRLVSDKPEDYEHAKEFIKDGKAKLPLVSSFILH